MMPNYYDGLTDGQRGANRLTTASETAQAVRALFQPGSPPPSMADEARALRAELEREKAKRSLSRAAMSAVKAVIAELPQEHRAALEAAMARTFDHTFSVRAHELGVNMTPRDLVETAEEMRRSILARR